MKIYLVVLSIWFLFLFISIHNLLGNIWLEVCNIKEYAKDIATRYAFNDELERKGRKKEEKCKTN